MWPHYTIFGWMSPPYISISNSGFGGECCTKPFSSSWHGSCNVRVGPPGQSDGLFSEVFGLILAQKVDPVSMLRCASITEAQAADRQI